MTTHLADEEIFASGIAVTGGTTTDTLTVSGVQTFTGNTTLSGTLTVAGLTTCSASCHVTGALTVSTTTNLTGLLTASGAINCTGTLAVTGAATVSTTLGVTGATTLSSTLGVTGTSTLAQANSTGVTILADGTLQLNNTGNTFSTSLKAGANTANLVLSAPIADAAANADAVSIQTPLSSDGSGNLTFSNVLDSAIQVNLTAAQVNAAYTTPVEVIPAPASGKQVVIDSMVTELVYGSAAFASGGAAYLQYGATAHGTNYATDVAAVPAAFLTGGASATIRGVGQINSTTGLANTVAGAAAITYTNATGNFTTGTGCSVKLFIKYRIVTL